MQSLLGGTAAVAVTLLVTSMIFSADPLAVKANPKQSEGIFQQKQDQFAPADEDRQDDALDAGNEDTERFRVAGPALSTAKPRQILNAIQSYTATAYSLAGRTASGLSARHGLIAADTALLPLGTHVQLDAGRYSGEYIVADSGGSVRGRMIDLWVPNSREACRFGRRQVRLTVLSYGARRNAGRIRRPRLVN